MKKIIALSLITFFSITTVFSINIDLDALETQFESMGEDLGGAVTSSATTGLVWSDAYIGNFPHFGVGVFTGATIIPVKAFSDLLESISETASLPSLLTGLGVPVPAAGIEARIGGLFLPFDIGVKYATLNDLSVADVNFNYSLIGGDIRYALVDGGLILPNISVGVGISRLTTDISIAGLLDGNYTILKDVPGYDDLILTNPDLNYGWESNVIELKASISKSLIFITPYAGINAAYSMTKVGGGITTSVTNGGTPLTQEDIDEIVEAARDNGASVPDIDADGFTTYSDSNAWNFKVNGGFSFNIIVAKIDLGINYDILNATYGGQLGFRIQL